eukprot:599789-Hanusia_phi.AAC.1
MPGTPFSSAFIDHHAAVLWADRLAADSEPSSDGTDGTTVCPVPRGHLAADEVPTTAGPQRSDREGTVPPGTKLYRLSPGYRGAGYWPGPRDPSPAAR